jgi:hypothetical protein
MKVNKSVFKEVIMNIMYEFLQYYGTLTINSFSCAN